MGIAYVSDIKNDNLSCYKLLQALTKKLLLSGSQEDLLFPAMSGNRVLSRPVTYAAMASVLKKSLAVINFSSLLDFIPSELVLFRRRSTLVG